MSTNFHSQARATHLTTTPWVWLLVTLRGDEHLLSDAFVFGDRTVIVEWPANTYTYQASHLYDINQVIPTAYVQLDGRYYSTMCHIDMYVCFQTDYKLLSHSMEWNRVVAR